MSQDLPIGLEITDDRFEAVKMSSTFEGMQVTAVRGDRALQELIEWPELESTRDPVTLVREALDRLHNCFEHSGGTDG